MKKKKILFLDNGMWLSRQKSVYGENYEISLPKIDFYHFALKDDNVEFTVDKKNLRRIVEMSNQGYDACFGIDSTAFLVWFVRKRLGMRDMPFLIAGFDDDLRKTAALCSVIEKHYGENPFFQVLESRKNHWIYYMKSQRGRILSMGIPAENLSWIISSFMLHLLCPESDDYFSLNGCRDDFLKEMPYGILSCGSYNRDFSTLFNVCSGLPLEVCVIMDRNTYSHYISNNRAICSARNIHIYPPVSVKQYIGAIKEGKFLVLLHKDKSVYTGQQTSCIGMKLGKAIISTKADIPYDYIRHEETGFLVDHDDEDGLKNKILCLWNDSGQCECFGRNAMMLERDLFGESEKAFGSTMEKI